MPLPDRDQLFDRIWVDHAARGGGTRVTWAFRPEACVPAHYWARLETAVGPNPGPDGWQDCGVLGADANALVDTVDRVREGGMTAPNYYRIVLAWGPGDQLPPADMLTPLRLPDSGLTIHRSRPVDCYGLLSRRAWLQAREILRQHETLFRVGNAARGWLMARRHFGITPDTGKATAPVSAMTGAVVSPWRQDTTGTEYRGGYHGPVPVSVLFEIGATDPKPDPERGPVDDEARDCLGTMLAFPPISRRDLVAIDGTGLRYLVGKVTTKAAVGSVPVVVAAELKQLSFKHPAYLLPVPESREDVSPVCG